MVLHSRLAHEPDKLYVALDFEQWEKDHSKLTEVGICVYDKRKHPSKRGIVTRHILIAEYV